MPNLTLVRGDKGYWLTFTVKDSAGAPVNLTGSTLVFKLQVYGETTLTISKEGEVVDPGSLGVARVKIESELISKSGECVAELEITWPGGKTLTADSISVTIKKDLPR